MIDSGPLSSTVVVQYLETGVGEEESLTALQGEKCPQETVRAIFAGIHTVLTAALKQPSLKPAVGFHDCSLVQPLVVLSRSPEVGGEVTERRVLNFRRVKED